MITRFHFLKKITLKNRKALKLFLIKLAKTESTKFSELNVIFCSDDYLLDINKKFLSHNYYTDIITFDLTTKSSSKSGEIYISTDRIKQNSIDYQTSINNELHRVVFHGVLHLCGYTDKKKNEKMVMTQKENYYLKLYFNSK
jgi:rRNA maturation RNase YbeY